MTRTPRPRPNQHASYPLHVLHRTFLLSCSFVVFPLYRSSSDTLGCTMSSPLLLPPLRLLLWPPMNPKSPPPKMWEKMSSMPPPPQPPSRRPCSP
uniref:Uncharacterized protein n=1 Tax=Paramormyrops kingsleyae TaxID=1676925 RepID=A0A3B3RNU2_9TELE